MHTIAHKFNNGTFTLKMVITTYINMFLKKNLNKGFLTEVFSQWGYLSYQKTCKRKKVIVGMLGVGE